MHYKKCPNWKGEDKWFPKEGGGALGASSY